MAHILSAVANCVVPQESASGTPESHAHIFSAVSDCTVLQYSASGGAVANIQSSVSDCIVLRLSASNDSVATIQSAVCGCVVPELSASGGAIVSILSAVSNCVVPQMSAGLTHIYISPIGSDDATLSDGTIIPLPFSTSDNALKQKIEGDQVFALGLIVIGNFETEVPDTRISSIVSMQPNDFPTF